MKILVAFLCGIALVLYPLWARRIDPRQRVKWVLCAIGASVLVWCALAVATTYPYFTGKIGDGTFEALLHLRRVISGVMIGLIVSLAIQGELLPLAAQRRGSSRQAQQVEN